MSSTGSPSPLPDLNLPDASLPSIEERLADLRPSRELLEFYRQKIADYDDEYLQLLKRFETLHAGQEERIKVESELREREAEIHQLQKALSDVQVFLMQERENVVRLYSENDRLKLQQFEDSKKIQALLALTGGVASGITGEVTYVHREPPSRAVVERVDLRSGGDPAAHTADVDSVAHPAGVHDGIDLAPLSSDLFLPPARVPEPAAFQEPLLHSGIIQGKKILGESNRDPNVGSSRKTPRLTAQKPSSSSGIENQTEMEVAKLKIKTLQAQLEEVTRTSHEQIQVLTEDRRVSRQEAETRVTKAEERFEDARQKSERLQELLQQTTQDLLSEKQNHRSAERGWMAEKDRLLRSLDGARDGGYESVIDDDDRDDDGAATPVDCDIEPVSVGAADVTRPDNSTSVKQTAEHSAQTLIPSLGTLSSRPPPRPRPISSGSGPRSVRVANALLQQRERQHQLEIEALQNQLVQSNKMCEMYRDQVVGVESELSRLREEDSLSRTLFKERSDGMAQRLERMKGRYEALERRRLLEAEGFRTDVRQLKGKLKEAEKQIYKLTVSLPVCDGEDGAILREVKAGASRAKKAQGEVNLLKARIYGIEHQLKRL